MVMEVTSVETHTLFQIDFASDGVWKYCSKFSRPTKAPLLSSTLLKRIIASGAIRKTASSNAAPTSIALPMRSVQCTLSRSPPATRAGSTGWMTMAPKRLGRFENAQAVRREGHAQRAARTRREFRHVVQRQVGREQLVD